MSVRRWTFEPTEVGSDEIGTAFRHFGVVLIRRALDPAEVRSVRQALDEAFARRAFADLPLLCGAQLLRYPAVWMSLFDDGVVAALKIALGEELCYQNDMDVQRNSFGLIRWYRHTGWHMDAGSERGNAYLEWPNYRFAKCGIFLQDFDNGWGGGIRVKLGTHRAYSERGGIKGVCFQLRRSIHDIAPRLRLDFDTHDVPTRAGDFCFFDSRVLHSSALPSRQNIGVLGRSRCDGARRFWPTIPREHTKYVLYWDACNLAMARSFLENSLKRGQSEPPGLRECPDAQVTWTRILSLAYPHDFPPDFVAAARRHRIEVASLSSEEAQRYKDKLKTMQLLHA